jgi:UPF0716 protein FxsA
MRFLIGLILLAFPIAEIWLLIELAGRYGWLLLFYLVAIGWLGLRLIREEKATFSVRMMQNMAAGGNLAKAVFGSARNIIAGVLLMLPGVITDIIAVTLLLIPIKSTQSINEPPSNDPFRESPYQAANDDVIEGEFRRED